MTRPRPGSWEWEVRLRRVCCKLWAGGDPDLLDPGLVAADLTDLALVTLLQLDIRSELAVNMGHIGCLMFIGSLALKYKPCWHLPRWSSSPADSFSLLSVLALTMLSITPLTPITCNDEVTVSDWSGHWRRPSDWSSPARPGSPAPPGPAEHSESADCTELAPTNYSNETEANFSFFCQTQDLKRVVI